jgi:hypothetical protein
VSSSLCVSLSSHLIQPGRNNVCLCQTAKYVRASYDALADIFECMENFLNRLRIYMGIQPTMAMTETIIKILVELLAVLALATKQINQGRLSKPSYMPPYYNS